MMRNNMHINLTKGAALCCCMLLTLFATAKVKPSSLFSNHMILQKGVPVSVWGKADEGEKVTVSFNGQTGSAITANSKWEVTLAPMPYATRPLSMTIAGKDTIIINDILIGEVWLCSGQSNMERQLGPRPPQPLITNWEKERDAANYPLIREYYVPLKYSTTTVDDVNSSWVVCSPQTVSNFSAIGYFFAKNLYEHLKVPVGIIFSAFGGTPAEDWTSKDALEANPELSDFVKNYNKIVSASYQPQGQTMGGLYNGMIYPLIPFAIKGTVWFQGEANNDRAKQYQAVLPNMINNWRQDFKQGDFPFLIIQLTPFKDIRPEIREAQLLVTKKVKNTALIVTTDCGDANNIHPSHKQPVGERTALAARGIAYGEKREYSGPVYKSYKVKGSRIIISFTHTGTGLTSKNGEALKGFTIAGADKQLMPAIATIKGGHVVIYSDKVTHPVAARYGWTNVPDVNLYNNEGLPASPFRTDVE
jgi:sialate O-acetylesterase